MTTDKAVVVSVRYVVVKDAKYLRAEDVVELLREAAAGEETDVRNRLEALVARLVGRKAA